MVKTPRKNRTLRWVALGVLATFLLASLAPLATAQGDERPRRDRRHADERPESDRPAKDFKAFKISLNGTAVTKDNVTYRIVLEGQGRAHTHSRDGNVTDAKGLIRLKAQLIDANGTVVKEGVIKARFHAHKTADGEWKWNLVATHGKPRGFPQLGLRGTATPADGGFALDGAGRAVVKLPEQDHRTVLKLDVAGMVSRA